MIIYVNYDKQTGQVTVDNSDYPEDVEMLVVNSGTIIDNNNSISFELSLNLARLQELESPPILDILPEETL